jgi:hypothetical protein
MYCKTTLTFVAFASLGYQFQQDAHRYALVIAIHNVTQQFKKISDSLNCSPIEHYPQQKNYPFQPNHICVDYIVSANCWFFTTKIFILSCFF